MISQDDLRPNPDQLLMKIKKKEKDSTGGKLKIFLGMAAGVGKTYAMLRAAKSLRDKGVDVVIGVIETHKRKETEDQIAGLEILPCKIISYKGKDLEEFDIDGALKRKPQIILVDELAHSNAPGSRNNKRYVDIMELLHAGIDVYTAINVQHLESRCHTVKEITDITIRETIPDSFLDLAHEIIVIDLAPEELLKRLKEGLIYGSERAFAAERNFFQFGNLTALRELALRAAAERVDKDLREYKQSHNIKNVWKTSYRLLVAVYASPYAENLIRSTRRLADTLDASWIGAYIDDDSDLDKEEKTLLSKNINLVQELGGEVITSKDEDIVRGLLRVASKNDVTQIVVGKSETKRWWDFFKGGPLVIRLMRASSDIDIYCIANVGEKEKIKAKYNLKIDRILDKTGNEFGLLTVIIIASWFAAGGLNQFLGYLPVGFLFLLVVSVSGLWLTQLSVFLLATLFAGIYEFFFIRPVVSSALKPEDFMMLSMFFISAAVVGHLTNRLKMRERNLSLREEKTQASYYLAKELLKANSSKELIEVGAAYLEKLFPYQVLILCNLHDDEEDEYAGSWIFAYMDKKEKAVIDWVLTNGQHAGRFTQTLVASKGYYIPLIGKDKTLGVIGLNVEEVPSLEADQISTFENFSNQIVSAIERERLRSPMASQTHAQI
jgi:two-component system sensor histidine kinase KdpD